MIKEFCDRCGKEIIRDKACFDIRTMIDKDVTHKDITLCASPAWRR